MKIGVSTANYYPEIDTEDIIELFGKNGIRCVEIFLNTISEMEEEYCRNLRATLDRYEMEVSSIHIMSAMFEPCLFDQHRRRREDFFRIYLNTLKIMKILDTRVYTFHGPSKYTEDNMELSHIADCYDRLNYEARSRDLFLAQENVAYLASGRPEFLRRIIENVKIPMTFTLDIKQARRNRVPVIEFIDVMEYYNRDIREIDKSETGIVNLHLSDGNDLKECLMPGEGTEDFKRIFNVFHDLGYKGNGILELYRSNFGELKDLLRGRELLERLYYERSKTVDT